MRSRIFSSLLVATVLAPHAVWAQDAEGFLAMQAEAEFGAAGGRP